MSITDYDLYERDVPALSGLERELYDEVSADVPWELVERFAELERVSGSDDEVEAAEYVTDRLNDFGVSYERHDPELYLSIPGDASLAAAGESFDAVKTVSFGGGKAAGELADFATGEASVDDLLSTDLGDVGDMTGKVAVLDGLLPIEAIGDLEDAGVEGVVVVHPHEREPHEGIATPVWGGAPEPGEEHRIPDVPVVVAAAPVGERLRELGEGTAVALTAETETGWFDCPVVEARIPAGGSETGDAGDDGAETDFVLLHGHYDSWHVGIADNATGDAALLELARVFQENADELSRDLRVCWWPGHSTGRYAGSTWYAEEFGLDIEANCVAQVNVDSPGAVHATEFEDMLCWMPEADALARSAIADVCGKDATEVRPPRAGDYSFSNLGVTGCLMLSSNIPKEVRDERGYHAVGGCGGHSNAWHLSTDTLDKADPNVLVRDIRVYATIVARLLDREVLPLDFRHTLDSHRSTVAEYDAAAGDAFDLSSVRETLADLDDAVDEFYDSLDSGSAPAAFAAGSVGAEKVNESIKGLSRALVRVDYTTEGQFEQDPATDRPSYPGLAAAAELDGMDEDERRKQLVALRRQRNRTVSLLEEALDALP
ncbi:MAG: M28 family metallopeptidase [Halolamina sp.]